MRSNGCFGLIRVRLCSGQEGWLPSKRRDKTSGPCSRNEGSYRGSGSGQELINDFARNVGQSEVTTLEAVSQFGVIEPQQAQQGGV